MEIVLKPIDVFFNIDLITPSLAKRNRKGFCVLFILKKNTSSSYRVSIYGDFLTVNDLPFLDMDLITRINKPFYGDPSVSEAKKVLFNFLQTD